MTEILTESFCERCGTRYTFQTAAPRHDRVKRLKVLSKGLRNYVLSDESTLEEALADARSDEERSISGQQLDAFHQTFNFCMSCRQYTCSNCWNSGENLCLTCAPDLSREVLPIAFPDLDPMAGVTLPEAVPAYAAAPANEDRAALAALSAWPETDLSQDADEAAAIEAAAVPEDEASGIDAPSDARIAAIAAASMAPPAAEAPAPAPEPEPIQAVPTELPAPVAPPKPPPVSRTPLAPEERAAVAAAQTAALLARFRPDQQLDKALEEYERAGGAAAEVAAEATPGPLDAAAVLAPGAPTAQPEAPIAPEPTPEPAESPIAAEPVEPPAAPAPAPERRDDRVEIPTWRIVAPDTSPETVPHPATLPAPSSPARETPVWPPVAAGQPTNGELQWPASPFAGATPPVVRAQDAMWAASSLEVVEKAGGGVQSCVSCGLPLSATARFCRRCGSRQG